MRKKVKFGYCNLTADFLHIGHIKYLKRCKDHCENLTVGIMSDECVKSYKGHYPIMNAFQRREVVKCLSMVDNVVTQNTFDFPHFIITARKFHGKNMLIFDSKEHSRKGADCLFSYTEGISSTMYRKTLK